MEDEALSRQAADDVTCPFFAPATTPGESHACLASGEPVPVTQKYATLYCVTTQHVRCGLYIAARAEMEREEVDVEAFVSSLRHSATAADQVKKKRSVAPLAGVLILVVLLLVVVVLYLTGIIGSPPA